MITNTIASTLNDNYADEYYFPSYLLGSVRVEISLVGLVSFQLLPPTSMFCCTEEVRLGSPRIYVKVDDFALTPLDQLGTGLYSFCPIDKLPVYPVKLLTDRVHI